MGARYFTSTAKKFIAFFIMLSFCLSFSCSKNKDTEEPEVLRPVKYMEAYVSREGIKKSFSGISAAGKISRVSFRVNGKLMEMKVNNGESVKKGQVIAILDDSDARLKLEKDIASLNRATVSRDTSKSNLKRLKSLYENNNVSLKEYESAKDAYANADATWKADKRSVELQEKELGYYTLYAPISGVISGKTVEIGENISVGQIIAEIHQPDRMEVGVGIPENYISYIDIGDKVEVLFYAFKNKVFQGEVTEVSFNIDSESSTYPVKINIIDPLSTIRPGMPSIVTFTLSGEENTNVMIVPVHSVGEDSSGRFLYIVKPTENGIGVIEKRLVTIGEMTSSGFEIKSGVKDGDLIVTAGISKLSDGLHVRMQ